MFCFLNFVRQRGQRGVEKAKAAINVGGKSFSKMVTETKTRRTINYLSDLVDELGLINQGKAKQSYEIVYQQFNEARRYILGSELLDEELRQEVDRLPNLIRPSLFNMNVGGALTVTVLGGLSNPFVTILILTILFPVSLPYLAVRAFMTSKTKSKTDQAKIGLSRIVNRLKDGSMR